MFFFFKMFIFYFCQQIDLTHEAENLLQFGQDFANDSRVVFPIPILELCRSNVIVETYESGLPLETVVNRMEEMPQEARTAVANAGVEMLLKMVRLISLQQAQSSQVFTGS